MYCALNTLLVNPSPGVKGFALLAGWSRKSSLGQVTNRPVEERMVPSVTAAVLAVERGARIVRVHDVRDTVDALKVWQALQAAVPAVGNAPSIPQQSSLF